MRETSKIMEAELKQNIKSRKGSKIKNSRYDTKYGHSPRNYIPQLSLWFK